LAIGVWLVSLNYTIIFPCKWHNFILNALTSILLLCFDPVRLSAFLLEPLAVTLLQNIHRCLLMVILVNQHLQYPIEQLRVGLLVSLYSPLFFLSHITKYIKTQSICVFEMALGEVKHSFEFT
jgi:hypothetical protein